MAYAGEQSRLADDNYQWGNDSRLSLPGRNGAHIVSARVSARNMALGQVKVEEKSNEITAIPELLDSLDVKGDMISIDAVWRRTDRAAKIREQEADEVRR